MPLSSDLYFMRGIGNIDPSRSHLTVDYKQSPVHTYITHEQKQKIEVVEALRAENISLRDGIRRHVVMEE